LILLGDRAWPSSYQSGQSNPHGIIVFFPSYPFLSETKAAFLKDGLLEKLNTKEKKGISRQQTRLFVSNFRARYFSSLRAPQTSKIFFGDIFSPFHLWYATQSQSRSFGFSSDRAIQVPANKKGGALLFAVVGARLSEGIKISDSLARGVVIVKFPFPSLASVELKERM